MLVSHFSDLRASRVTTEVPYRARLRAHFGDGGTKERDIQGTYVETLLSDVEVIKKGRERLLFFFVVVVASAAAAAAVLVFCFCCYCCW